MTDKTRVLLPVTPEPCPKCPRGKLRPLNCCDECGARFPQSHSLPGDFGMDAILREREDMADKLSRDEITIHDFAEWQAGIIQKFVSATEPKAVSFGGYSHPGDIA